MTEYPKCMRCGETLYQGHICAGWPDRYTASTPPSSAPETRTTAHSHRCMRCQKEFPCVAPVRCEAGPVVLPRIVYLDIFGRIQIRDHCRNVLYKGFVGQATFDTEAKVYHGEVEGIRDVVTFEADDEDGIESAFQASVDDYLDMLDVPIGKHDPYGTHTNGDGSPVLIPPAASHSPGTPAPAGGTLTACPRAVYYCMACPLTFPDAASSNAHHDATGHNQTWRPVMAFHARNPAATAASGIGTTEDADCFDELTESAAVNDVLASMARDYPGSVARVVRYLREVKADRDRMDWWEAHLPESIYWKDRGGNLKQGTTMRRFTDAARASVSRDASLPKSAEQQVAARSSTESPQ